MLVCHSIFLLFLLLFVCSSFRCRCCYCFFIPLFCLYGYVVVLWQGLFVVVSLGEICLIVVCQYVFLFFCVQFLLFIIRVSLLVLLLLFLFKLFVCAVCLFNCSMSVRFATFLVFLC